MFCYLLLVLLYFYCDLARLRYNELEMIRYINLAYEYYPLDHYQKRMDFVIESLLNKSSLIIYKEKRLIRLYYRLIRLYPIHPFVL